MSAKGTAARRGGGTDPGPVAEGKGKGEGEGDGFGDPARMHHYDTSMQSLGDAVVKYALERSALDPPPLSGPRTQSELDQLGNLVTADGLGPTETLRLFTEALAPASITQDHPRNVAFVPTAPTEASILFDLVVGASAIFGGSWKEGAGAVWAENQALRWIADLAGLPQSAGGVFVSGGSAGNLSALVTARHDVATHWGRRPPRWYIAASAGVHSSVDAAARVMDIEILRVPTDERGRMTAPALRSVIDAVSAQGIVPGTLALEGRPDLHAKGALFAIVVTAGTTNGGLVDDLPGIAAISEELDLWMHVDGAYGGAALAAPSARHLFAGVEEADSFVVDPHKWLFAPYDCAALLYRDPALARAAHTQHAGYLDVLHEDEEWNPSDYAFHLTRRARGLPFWFSLVAHGTRAYEEAVEAGLRLARDAGAAIEADPVLELVQPPELSVVLFRRVGWGKEEYDEWSDRLLAEGTAFCVPTTWLGETVLRFCFVSPRTTMDDVALILATLH